jgi:hypothetical protein
MQVENVARRKRYVICDTHEFRTKRMKTHHKYDRNHTRWSKFHNQCSTLRVVPRNWKLPCIQMTVLHS